jgi:hypothetical protein
MEIQLKNPATHELREFNRLLECVKKNHNAEFISTIESDGYIFCTGSLVVKDGEKVNNLASAKSFMPIGNNAGHARIMAEILCLSYCLESIGENIEWLKENEVKAVPVNPKSYSLSEDYLKGSTSLADCIRRVMDSGYPNMDALKKHLADIRTTLVDGRTRRATKYDVIDFVLQSSTTSAPIQAIKSSKPLRSGFEWSRVKKLALGLKELPEGYKNADEFANFASKSEVDAIIELQNNANNE